MFNLQGSELIIILLLALVVLGPEKLPDAMRRAGKFYAELKKMSSGFQEEFRAAVDEPMREMRETADLIRDSADFSKLQDGEREEKPKSAEMVAPADPDASPSDEVPFRAADGNDLRDHPDADGDAPFDSIDVSDADDEFAGPRDPDRARGASLDGPTVPPPPPAPFSGSHTLAAATGEEVSDSEPADTRPAPFSGANTLGPTPHPVDTTDDAQPGIEATEADTTDAAGLTGAPGSPSEEQPTS